MRFSSLTTITQQVKPEKFSNYELGAKRDVRRYFSLTTAAYRLDRTNTRATDANDPTRIVQTGSQRTNGYERGGNPICDHPCEFDFACSRKSGGLQKPRGISSV